MYQVKRAIILAAGMGNRLQPVTLEIPKPLIPVNGVRMIDTIIKGLQANGIHEIYVVVGYKKAKFYSLKKEYPSVGLIENPYFDTCNNISSLYMAREYIEDVMILDGDQMVYNASVLKASFVRSGYNCVWEEGETDEWLLQVQDGVVTHCSKSGGKRGWQLFSISRWNACDGRKLKGHLEREFEVRKNRQIYWDDVPLFCYPDEYELGICQMDKGDVLEIDSYTELLRVDSSYAGGCRTCLTGKN